MADTSVRLLIDVVSDATRELAQLRRAARQTEASVENLERAGQGRRLQRSVAATNNELLETRVRARQARIAANNLARDGVAGQRRFAGSVAATNTQVGILRTGFNALLGQLAILAAGFGAIALARGLISTSDAALQLQGRLRLVTDGVEDLNRLQRELFQVSQATRSALESNAELFVRLRLATRDLGVAEADLLGLITTLNQAIQVSGATSQEASQGIIQFAQGLASGALRGDELRSVLEQLPAVALAIADGLGVTVGQLRELGEAGDLTADAVLEALRNSADEVETQFAAIPVTIDQALTQIRNAFLQIFQGDETQPIIDALTELRDTLQDPATIDAIRTLTRNVVVGAQAIVEGIRTVVEAFAAINGADTREAFDDLSTGLQVATLAFRALRTTVRAFLGTFRLLATTVDLVGDALNEFFGVTSGQQAAGAFNRTILGIEEDFLRVANLAPEAAQAVADAFANIRGAVATGDISAEEGLAQAQQIAQGTIELAEDVAERRQQLQREITQRQIREGRARVLAARAEVQNRIAAQAAVVEALKDAEEEITKTIEAEQEQRADILDQAAEGQIDIAQRIKDAQRGLFSESTQDALTTADRISELRTLQEQLAQATEAGNVDQVQAVQDRIDALARETDEIDNVIDRLNFLRRLSQLQAQVDEAAVDAQLRSEGIRQQEIQSIQDATREVENFVQRQRDLLGQLGDLLATLQVEPIDLTFNTTEAESQLDDLEARLERLRRSASVVFGGIGEFNAGGSVPGFQTGGSVSGPGGTDNVPARLTAGEFVVNREAAQRFAGLLNAINFGGPSDVAASLQRTLPGLTPSAVGATRGSSQDLLTLDFRLNGQTAARMTGQREEALAVAGAFKEMRRALGRRG